MHIFDTSAFIVLKHYYRQSFPSLWTGLEELITNGVLVSTREVYNELKWSRNKLPPPEQAVLDSRMNSSRP